MSAETPPPTPSENTSLKNTWSRYLSIAIIVIVTGLVLLLVATNLEARFQALETDVEALSVTDSEISGRWLLAEVTDLNERLDFGVSNFNILIGWTQFVGVMIALVGAAVVVVGIRDSRKDHADLQRVLADAEEKLDKTRDALSDAQSTIRAAQDKLEDVARTNQIEIERTAKEIAKLRQASAAAQIGQRQLAIGNLREAVRLFEVALDNNSDDDTLIYLWADARLRLDSAKGAFDAFQQLKKLHKEPIEHPSASALYAYSARLLGDQADDEGIVDEANDLYSKSEEAYRAVRRKHEFLLDSFGESVFGGLAGLYRRQARSNPAKRKVAIETYEFCRKITPYSSYILNNLALLQYCEDQAASEKTFDRCLELAERKRIHVPNDYWAVFDSLTARIALRYEAQDLTKDLEEVILLVRSEAQDDEPIKKFLSGLEELQCVAQDGKPPAPEPPALQDVIRIVRAQLDKGRGA